LVPQPSLGLDLLRNLLPLKMAEFLGGFSTFFYRVGLLAPHPTPTLEDLRRYPTTTLHGVTTQETST
jgi:hypothetical protein